MFLIIFSYKSKKRFSLNFFPTINWQLTMWSWKNKPQQTNKQNIIYTHKHQTYNKNTKQNKIIKAGRHTLYVRSLLMQAKQHQVALMPWTTHAKSQRAWWWIQDTQEIIQEKNEETEEKPQVARHVKYKKGYHWTIIWGHKSTIGVSQQGYVNLDGFSIPRSILVYVSGLNW